MNALTRKLGTPVLVITLAVAAASCGSKEPGKPAAPKPAFQGVTGVEVARKAVAAMQGLDAVHVAGSVADDGGAIGVDLTISASGDCAGRLGIGDGNAEIIALGNQQFIRGDEGFWIASAGAEEGPAAFKVIGDKWLKSTGEAEKLRRLCDLDRFLGGFETDELKDAKITKGPESKINGVAVMELTSVEDDGDYKFYVATKGKPYLVRFGGAEGKDDTTMTFSEFDEPVDAEAPAEAEVFEPPSGS